MPFAYDPIEGTEREMLLFALDRARQQFRWKTGGLDAAGLRKPLGPGAMTLGGLIKHLALAEDAKVSTHLLGEPMPSRWDAYDGEGWEWRSAADDSPEELYALWETVVERARAAWQDVDLDAPSKWSLPSGESPQLRRILVDMCEEYTRHTGHADLLRENVDGLVGEDPPQ